MNAFSSNLNKFNVYSFATLALPTDVAHALKTEALFTAKNFYLRLIKIVLVYENIAAIAIYYYEAKFIFAVVELDLARLTLVCSLIKNQRWFTCTWRSLYLPAVNIFVFFGGKSTLTCCCRSFLTACAIK